MTRGSAGPVGPCSASSVASALCRLPASTTAACTAPQVPLHRLILRVLLDLRHDHPVFAGDRRHLIHEGDLVPDRGRLAEKAVQPLDQFPDVDRQRPGGVRPSAPLSGWRRAPRVPLHPGRFALGDLVSGQRNPVQVDLIGRDPVQPVRLQLGEGGEGFEVRVSKVDQLRDIGVEPTERPGPP